MKLKGLIYSIRTYQTGSNCIHVLTLGGVKRSLKMTDFTIHNALEQMRREADIFKPVLGKGINLEKVTTDFQKTILRWINSF